MRGHSASQRRHYSENAAAVQTNKHLKLRCRSVILNSRNPQATSGIIIGKVRIVSNNPSSDAELVVRLKQRDHNALKELLHLHGAKIYGTAMKYMHDEHEAQEVMQDALVTVWKKIGSFEGRSAFTTWLYRVTANAALMALRKKRRFAAEISADDSASADALRPL